MDDERHIVDLVAMGLEGRGIVEVCRRARLKSNVPILILSDRDGVKDGFR